jgi:hypothetical protein
MKKFQRMMKINLFLLGYKLQIEVLLISEKTEVFSMNKVWNKLIKDKNLQGPRK